MNFIKVCRIEVDVVRKSLLLLLLASLLFLISCSKLGNDGKDSDKTSKGTFPLTGIKAEEGADRRIVSVMINNHPAARPQSGLSQADIVFEMLAEGNMTRFLAFFQSEQPEVVGPVRSAREYYFDLAEGYDALYVYHGAAKFINAMIYDRQIEYLNGALHDNDGYLFKRESFREAPHNSYLQYNSVYEEAEAKGYESTKAVEPLPFLAEEETNDGDPAHHITISYEGKSPENAIEYVYDEQTEKLIRYEDQEQTVELNTEVPVEVDNLFIVEAHHEVIDDEGRRDIDLQSGGNAYLIQKGHLQKVEWKNEEGRIIPVIDGQPIGFLQGKTWVNVVPSTPGLEQSITITNE